MDDYLRLSDAERLAAMSALGNHFTEGRIDTVEFDERTLAVSQARTRGEIRPLFDDLPGRLEAALGGGGELVEKHDEDAELERIRTRGALIEKWDGVIGGVTLAAFFILMFAFSVSWAWVVWPVMGAAMMIPRLVNRFSDSDEKAYEELKKAEEEARQARLERAKRRLRELE
ncbi:DUF1707 SHOCT-like domain-containing protein [Corynebacterium humireducens]|nr:DUF1707 domain-containing protein [Corynebacterium humireducens]